jgi:hypothetical protein
MSAYMILLLCDCSASPKKVQHALDFGCCARVSSGLQRRVSRAGLGRRAELKAEMSGWALVKDGSGCYTRAQKNLHGPSERRIQYTSCNQLDRRRVEWMRVHFGAGRHGGSCDNLPDLATKTPRRCTIQERWFLREGPDKM